MIINKAYKTELHPNNKQRNALARSAGCARFAFNWGLAQRIELYKSDKKSTTAFNQHKDLCKLKEEKFPWMYESTKCAPQEALRDLDKAFKNFFRGIKSGQKIGFPKFKSKHRGKDSFRISTGAVYVTGSSIKLPLINAPIRLKEKNYIPVKDIKFNSYSISKEADRWFISVQCEENLPDPTQKPEEIIGVDLGIKTLATISDGTTYDNPKNLNKLERSLKRQQREVSRRKKGSSKRRESVKVLQVKHKKISNCRKDVIHKMTSSLVKTKPKIIVIEDLAVKNMLKNHKLSKALSDVAFGEIRRQLTYKSLWYGSEVLVADRFFPSSKLCSKCGQVKEDLTLKDRIYECGCGNIIDRDLNAALNLKRYGEFHRSLSNQKACGEERLQSVAVRSTAVGGALQGSRNLTSNLSRVGRFV